MLHVIPLVKVKPGIVASDPDERFLDGLLEQLEAKNVESLLETPEGVEVSARTKDGKPYLFVMNHNETTQSYDLGTAKAHDLLTNRELSGSVRVLKPVECNCSK